VATCRLNGNHGKRQASAALAGASSAVGAAITPSQPARILREPQKAQRTQNLDARKNSYPVWLGIAIYFPGPKATGKEESARHMQIQGGVLRMESGARDKVTIATALEPSETLIYCAA